jgi:hypothetical protein
LLFVLAIVVRHAAVSNVVLFVIALAYMFSGIWARAAYSWSRAAAKAGRALRIRPRPNRVEAGSAETFVDFL